MLCAPCSYSFFLALSFLFFFLQIVTDNNFEVLRRIFVDFEGINLRRKFLSGLEPENIHMMIGETLDKMGNPRIGGNACIYIMSSIFLFYSVGSMTVDCLGILNDLSDCEEKLFPIGYQYGSFFLCA